MTWGELRHACEVALDGAGRERPARLVSDWFDDLYGRAARKLAEAVPTSNVTDVERDLARLAGGEPLAYVTGVAHFYGYEVDVGPGVLIPRPETEELVRWILEREGAAPLRFADLCTGSGCIAVALALRRLRWGGHAVDVSPYACEAAEANVRKHDLGERLAVHRGDVLADDPLLPQRGVELIVCNPPYIPTSDWGRVQAGVAKYEPQLALRVSDADPLRYYRRLADLAVRRLPPGGRLYVECNDRYTREVAELCDDYGLLDVEVFTDMQGKLRHVRALAA